MIAPLPFALLVLVGITISFTIGRRIGARAAVRDPKGFTKGNSAIDGAVYGLFALLLAFTFSGAATRFDGRRELMGREANAIGTAYLRLDLLPDEVREKVKKNVRDYLDARIETFARVDDRPVALAALARAQRLQSEIWTDAVAATRAPGGPDAIALLPPLNAMFDILTTQRVAWETHPPKIVYAMLGVLAIVAALLGGHAMGAAKTPHLMHTSVYALVLATTTYIILDLEYPRLGLIRIDAADQVLVDLRATMGAR
ncbi:MAG TPA: hypothetical protein VH054_29375 [Polyangiaceae bacterium]|jgi:hypothetical protein|nr:hypothetical protein [Polyangiaceae bacterium]